MKSSAASFASWLIAASLILGGCATLGSPYIPKSPFLDVPLSMRAPDGDTQKLIANLEIKGDWPAIVALAASQVARNPTDSDWRVVLGYARLQQSNLQEAIDALAPVVERNPEEVDGHNLLGEALRLSGQADRARQTLERASFAHPHSHVNRFLLGELYREGNLLERAKAAYGESVRIDPEFSLGWLGLARVLARTGPQEEYEIALKRLGALDPEMARTVPARQSAREAAPGSR